MGSRENFTAERVRIFRCEPGRKQSIFWDAEAPGLGVRVTAGGAASYIFESRVNGQTIRVTIGSTRSWALDLPKGVKGDSARRKARTLQSMVDQGIDPRAVERERLAALEADRQAQEAEAQQATAAATTFGTLWLAYIAARSGEWGALHLRDHYALARAAVPLAADQKAKRSSRNAGPIHRLLSVKLTDLSPEFVSEWVATERATRPTAAALAYRLVRGCLRWASEKAPYRHLVQVDAVGPAVARGLAKPRAKVDDCLQREQLKPWFAAVRQQAPVVAAYLQILLLIGSRREELAALKWTDVDFQWNVIRLHDKVDGERSIPMTAYVKALLAGLKARNETPPPDTRILRGKRIAVDVANWKPSQWVFSSATAASGRLVEPRIGHVRALELAGLPHLTLHGLRRSFGTLAEWVEVPVGVVAQIQGHKPSALAEKHYRRRPIDLLRKWHQQVESWMLAEAGIKFEAPKSGLHAVDSNTA